VATNRLPFDAPGLEDDFQRVEVRRSARRKKTSSSRAEEHEWVTLMARRMSERRRKDRLNSDGALAAQAAHLADRYLGGVRPASICWVTNQSSRWGSCCPEDRTIRISIALADYPAWVRDYVIVHELAHLIVPDHSSRFWDLVARYPLTERARGFLIAKGMEEG
jgi:hypothetical protein